MEFVIKDVMQSSGVKFGTSGARGLADEMTDQVCYIYTKGFLQYLEQQGEISKNGETVAIAGDLRPSTGRIMAAVARAAADMGYSPMNCGRIPSPAVALYGIENRCPAIMVTGSHIPDDRNGIKFNKASGEVLKSDEQGIVSQVVELAVGALDGSFEMPTENPDAGKAYVARYLDIFPSDCLAGKKLGIYQHSAVGREMIVRIFEGLGADVTPLGWSDTFIPVDTEAIREEDVALARQWAAGQDFDAILSTDGDSDRPLISDEAGAWLRGDIAGILAARYLGADSVSTPVSCNTALEKTGWFADVRRTKIGSPFVIASMNEAVEAGSKGVVGYEANGGFLTNSDLPMFGKSLKALPTRDAVLPVLSIILLSIQENKSVSGLLTDLPQRFTASDRIQNFPTEESARIIERFKDAAAVEEVFGDRFGRVEGMDRTDGLRITFQSMEVLHLRPSGNAPEFRCYNEAASQQRVLEMQRQAMDILLRLKG
ncbi:phosphomannomutase [Tichowtungia aerotolerans]|uniref:Phosphomannomutase n=1 Tax=Tichowtungia aerotolerans TaxID=2697043 RepID=A0A6P1M9Y3_9BACT|nr:phosphomannomutase [Tichowtungia aerotolerans]QHI68898.1 phosphomannomutase [Tichowtungia aerotolerans]